MTVRSRAHRILRNLQHYTVIAPGSSEGAQAVETSGSLIGKYSGDRVNGRLLFHEKALELADLSECYSYRNMDKITAPGGKNSAFLEITMRDSGKVLDLFPHSVSDTMALVRYFMRVRDDAIEGRAF